MVGECHEYWTGRCSGVKLTTIDATHVELVHVILLLLLLLLLHGTTALEGPWPP
jgi:hypothetical protein